ncbi:uncharacterized protein C8Q71DRAFT_740445 [Rhodofomes roseus]|uniref:EamA domain-containing protein n=1 Tax=Rhodofomes roseus TaxID=34475 RepID=A0ABQ8KS30_9APHY|nr:uncharacterized protein C8Q71DRAFT_740445 [Rhodofomes roseus]KAH9840626.1 hypothetical protein C8Q71DRAFT_740445 [Rhodofomes roseus]
MTSTTSRTPYDAQTPDRTTFGSDVPLARFDTSEVDAALRRPSFYLDSSFNAKWKKFVSKCKTTCKTTYKNNIGLLLIAASTAFGSLMSTLVKKLNSVDPPVPMLELIFIRMSMTWICCMTYMWIMKIPDPFLGPKGIRLLLVLRGVCGFTGLSGSYFSLQYLSISDATVLQFLAPMCTGIVGALVLKEHFTRSQALASFFSLVGVVLIARPTFLFGHIANNSDTALDPPVVLDGRSDYEEVLPAQRLRAVGFAMFGVVGATGAYTTIRAIGKRAHALHSVTAFSMQCITVSSILMVVFRTTPILPNKLEWVGMLLAIGFCGFFAQMLLTLGLQRETAGRGTMAIYVQIIFATINDIVFFHSTPNLLSTIGTTIIIASAIYVATSKKDPGLHKRQQSLISSPADHSLEEGLLENEEDSAEPSESKDEVSASVITVKSPDPSHEGKCNGKAGTLPS